MTDESTNLPAPIVSELALKFPIINPTSNQELREVLEANLGPGGLSERQLDRIKVPGSGATHWTVPGLNGEESAKELSGLIVGWRNARLYWKTPFNERGKTKTPPDCLSTDGFYGIGDPGGDCADCPLAQFGSDPKGGRGQACRQVRQLLLLRDDHILPEIITVPPTSIKPCSDYFARLGGQRIAYFAIVTHMRLERVQNPDGIDYARIVFSGGLRLSAAEKAAIQPFQQQMMAMLKPMDIDATDYTEA